MIRATSGKVTAIILAGALLAALAATAQQPPPRGAGAPPRGAAMGPPRGGQNDAPDTPGTGAYPAMKEEVASLPDHVVYRPANLAALGNLKLGVVAWGNGGCSDDGASARNNLLELASHGYLVIAAGRIYSGPGAHPAPAEPKPFPRTPLTTLTEAIDWALAENAR